MLKIRPLPLIPFRVVQIPRLQIHMGNDPNQGCHSIRPHPFERPSPRYNLVSNSVGDKLQDCDSRGCGLSCRILGAKHHK